MTKLICIFLSLILAVPSLFAGSPLQAANRSEAGVFVPGEFFSISGTADGSVYLLGADHQVVKLLANSEQQIIPIPLLEGADVDDYLCDMVADDQGLSFCGYAFSGIYRFDFAFPEEIGFFEVSVDDQPINPMMIARKGNGWCLKDAEERTIQVAADGSVKLLPQYSSIESDKFGTSVIIPPPYDDIDKIVYPGAAYRENKEPIWSAPKPESPRDVVSMEYLGSDSEQRDIFLVVTCSGELDAEYTLYAVKNGETMAIRAIIQPTANRVMRYCRLSPDDSILVIIADPNGREGVMIKRLNLNTTLAPAG